MIRKIFAAILFLLFVMSFVPIAVAVGVYHTFLDPQFYKGEFVDLVYEFAVDELPRNVDLENVPLNEEDLKVILTSVFVEEDVAFLVDSLFEQFYALETDEEGWAEFTIPLSWIGQKSDVISERVAGEIARRLASCEPDEVLRREFPQCIPEGLSKIDFQAALIFELDSQLFSEIPNDVSFRVQFPEQIRGNVYDFFDFLIRQVLMIGMGILVLLLVLLGLVIYRPWTLVLRWEGKAVFGGSLSVFLLMMFLLHLPNEFLTSLGYESFGRVYSFVISALISNMFVYIFPLMLFSFALWISMLVLEKLKNKTNDTL